MEIEELTKKVRTKSKGLSQVERIKLLNRANVIDNDGFYSSEFFSKETVAADKQKTPFRKR